MSGPTPDPLRIGVIVVSDTRTLETDRSGALLVEALGEAGHEIVGRLIVKDERWALRKQVCTWVADGLDVIITTGSTGVTGRDISPEAVEPLFDKPLHGFGELFRQVSYGEIGASALQSRATGGLCANTLVFAIPGSTGACRTALDSILLPQLDRRTRPCNFASMRGRFSE